VRVANFKIKHLLKRSFSSLVANAYLSGTLSSPSLVYQHDNIQGLVTYKVFICSMYISLAECDSKNCQKEYTKYILFPVVNSLNLNKLL
jgi:hypothetical protein